jgi:hypothetical protein
VPQLARRSSPLERGATVINRPESPAVANALAALCLRLVSIVAILTMGLVAMALVATLLLFVVLALVLVFAWFFLPAMVPRQ